MHECHEQDFPLFIVVNKCILKSGLELFTALQN